MERIGKTGEILIYYSNDGYLVLYSCVYKLRQERNVVFWSNIVSSLVCPGVKSAFQLQREYDAVLTRLYKG